MAYDVAALVISTISALIAALSLVISFRRGSIIVFSGRRSRSTKILKRYVLFKVLCFQQCTPQNIIDATNKAVREALGEILKRHCSFNVVTVAMSTEKSGYLIARIKGARLCVDALTYALSTQHISSKTYIMMIPVKTSGLLKKLVKLVAMRTSTT